MNRKRIFALSKLGLLFGGPIAVVLGLFNCGVYCGATHQTGILAFERDWLGMDVKLPADPKASDKDAKADDKKADDKKADDKKADDKKADDKKADDKKADDATLAAKPEDEPASPPPEKEPPVAVVPQPQPDPVAEPLAVEAGPDARVDALAEDLADRHAMAITIRVKVLVDEELIGARADWIDYVQRTVSEASLIYERQFGITLELSSVGRWPVATAGMDATQLLDDLRTRSREQGDILVGLTDRPLDEHVSGKADTPIEDNPYNGAYALVYGNVRSTRPHLRTLLHEIGHTLGALDIVDHDSPGWLGKSWMSYAPARDTEAPWIDPANRQRVLQRKDMPFAPEDDQ